MEQCTQSETRREKKCGMGEGEVGDGWEKINTDSGTSR